MKKSPKWFNMDEAIKTENRQEWPTFYLGINRIIAAKEKEGNTEELQQLEREWKLGWEMEEATPDPSENGGERKEDYTTTPTEAGAGCLETAPTPEGEDERRREAAPL